MPTARKRQRAIYTAKITVSYSTTASTRVFTANTLDGQCMDAVAETLLDGKEGQLQEKVKQIAMPATSTTRGKIYGPSSTVPFKVYLIFILKLYYTFLFSR
ncbi:hypothetical protein GOODEAATRI_034025 [Goodea atripinnis]|uniref:Uncharacterized protein n=1 Tax=Goodea atripinnis TaxID=208336 RepID=A0ABV0MXF1_9TELE